MSGFFATPAPPGEYLPPAKHLYLSDSVRAVAELGSLFAGLPALKRAPRGDGHPVLVIPGLLAADFTTVPLRRFITRLGYEAYGWELGLNVGPTRRVVQGLRDRLDRMAQASGSEVTLIGWSLGGVFARVMARNAPEAVRSVITLGSPFRLISPSQAHASKMFIRLAPLHMAPAELPPPEHLQPALPVPATSIYSRFDGQVSWQACVEDVDDQHENVAVYSSHLGFGHNPSVLWVIADRLAQPPGEWRPFRAPCLARPLYPEPDVAPPVPGR